MKKKIKVKKPKAVIPFDPIEDALTNPIEELPRERDKDGNIIKV